MSDTKWSIDYGQMAIPLAKTPGQGFLKTDLLCLHHNKSKPKVLTLKLVHALINER